MAALVNDADDQEQHAGGYAVIDLLDDAARDADRGQREHAERHHRHVAHARIGDEPLPIRLRQRDKRAIDDADDGQPTIIGTK